MAGPGIVGVQPVPGQPGAYSAQLANGNNMMVTGQAGESLFKRFAPSLAGMASSVPGVGPALAGATLAGAALKRDDDMGAPAPGVAAPAPAPIRGAEPTAAPGQSGPTQPAQLPPENQSGPVPLGYTMEAVDGSGRKVQGNAMRMPDGSIGVYVPPRAGSPGGLTALGKGAIAASKQMEQTVAESRAVENQAREEGAMLAQEDAQRQLAYHEEQKVQNMLVAQDQQDENDAIAQQVSERQAKYDQLREDALKGRVDENQYMRGSQGVFSALGMALGAFGAALARTPNFAADFVQSQIDRNIRRQEAELAMKGKAADNALADLVREKGSLKDGKAVLRQLLTERSAIEANITASTAKDQQIAARAREISAQLAGQVAIQDKVRRQSDLEHVVTSRIYNAPGSPGSAGGFLQPTLGGVQDVKNLQKPDEQSSSTKALPTERTAMIADDADLVKLGEKILKNPALQGDEEFWGPDGSLLRKLPGGSAIVSPDTNELYQDLQRWQNARIKAITGAGVSNQEAERIAAAEVGNMSKNSIRRGVEAGVANSVTRARGNLAPLTAEQQRNQIGTIDQEVQRRILGQQSGQQ